MKTILIVSSILLLGGCATSSGVIETGPDSYMISKEAGSGFSGTTALKTDNLRTAGAFCKEQGKYLKVTATNERQQSFGVFPNSEVQFMCLKEGDPGLNRTVLVPVTATTVDKVLGK